MIAAHEEECDEEESDEEESDEEESDEEENDDEETHKLRRAEWILSKTPILLGFEQWLKKNSDCVEKSKEEREVFSEYYEQFKELLEGLNMAKEDRPALTPQLSLRIVIAAHVVSVSP